MESPERLPRVRGIRIITAVMVITFVCDVLGEENNGTTIATLNVARAMKAKGHEVRILCPDEFRRGQEGFYVLPKINFGPLDHYVASNGVVLASTKDKQTIRQAIEGSDVCHFNFCGVLSSYAVKLCKKLGIATTASMHTQAENYTNHVFMQHWHFANHMWYMFLYKHLFSQVDAIHYPSEFIHQLFQRECRFTTKAPYVISNGIHTEYHRAEIQRPAELKGKVVLAFSARYSKEKNHAALFKALKYSKHAEDIVLLLPGAGPLEKKLRRLGKRYCANPPILGFHDHSEMMRLLNMADIYVCVSQIDIEPIAFLEAVSIGLPPILTDSPLSSVSGFALDRDLNVYHDGDLRDLATKIDYFIEHPYVARQNGLRYLGMAQQFRFEDSMDKMEQMFLEVVANHKAAHAAD